MSVLKKAEEEELDELGKAMALFEEVVAGTIDVLKQAGCWDCKCSEVENADRSWYKKDVVEVQSKTNQSNQEKIMSEANTNTNTADASAAAAGAEAAAAAKAEMEATILKAEYLKAKETIHAINSKTTWGKYFKNHSHKWVAALGIVTGVALAGAVANRKQDNGQGVGSSPM